MPILSACLLSLVFWSFVNYLITRPKAAARERMPTPTEVKRVKAWLVRERQGQEN